MKKLNNFFDSKKEYGAIFLRLAVGVRLVIGTWNYALNPGRLGEVRDFFQHILIPVPTVTSALAVYAQFICGILFIIGLWVRPAAIIIIVTFIVAISVVDIHLKYEEAFSAWAILAAALFFLFHGAGKLSLDERLMN